MKDYKLLFAVMTVALVWGTTFMGIRIAVESIPGWFVAGMRQFLAGTILMIILLYRKELKWIGWKSLSYQIIFAFLMLVMANGLTTVAEEELTSSLAALISACSPILVFLGSLAVGIQKFSLRAIMGIIICFSGILLIFWDGLGELANPQYLNGVLMMFLAILGWAAGTIFTKKMNIKSENIILNLVYQFLFAGIFQLLLALMVTKDYSIDNWTVRSILATIYLAVFGSVITFFAFHYALTKISPIQVSILSYINTIIAIFLGWLILDEPISVNFLIAAIFIMLGVFIINYKPEMFRKKNKKTLT